MMKKSLSLLLILTLILSSFSLVASAANGVDQVMSDFNIMPQSCSADSDKLVTRGEFAYTIANILGSGVQAPRATNYIDVTEDMEDSGYIYFATVNGFLLPSDNMFCPNDPISLHDFNDAVVKLLAYETISMSHGGGNDGNMRTVRDLKIYTGVTITNYDSVTVKQYRQLVYNLMTANIAVFDYNYTQDGTVSLYRTGETKTILSQFFGISRYYGSITSVNHAKPSVKFYVTKNVTKANPENLTTNMTYDFLSNGKVDLNFYLNIPVEIWTNKDGVIVYIAPQANVEVFYDVITAVNGKTNPNSNGQNLQTVKKGIELSRDEKVYDIDSSIQIRYNGKIQDEPNIQVIGKYAKIVLINNKVTYIETWDLTEGGIVTEVNNSYISYTKGEAQTRLKKIGEYEEIMVIIDGRSTDRSQIKPGSLFHYYQPTTEDVEKGAKEMLVIVVSEKTIMGSFDSMSSHNEVVEGKTVTIIDELEIGRNYYPVEKEKIYVSENGQLFQTNVFDGIYDTQVLCYVDIFGNIGYIASIGEVNERNEFTGYVMGSASQLFEGTKVKIQKIYPELEEVVYVLPEGFTNYVDNPATTTVSASDIARDFLKPLTWADRTTAYKKMYKFTVNSKGEITEVSEPDYFLMFGETHDVQQIQADGTLTTPTPVPVQPAIDVNFLEFPNDGYVRVFLNFTNKNGHIFGTLTSTQDYNTNDQAYYNLHGEYFIVLSKDGDKGIVPVVKTFTDLRAKGPYDSITDMNVAMLAAPNDSSPYIWLIYGETEKIYNYKGDDSSIVESVTPKYDLEKEKLYYEVCFEGEEDSWKLDSIALADFPKVWDSDTNAEVAKSQLEPGAQLEPGMTIEYLSGAIFCENEAYITTVVLSTGEFTDEFDYMGKRNTGYLYGEFDKIIGYRLFMKNGGAYHLANTCGVTGLKVENGKAVLKKLSIEDLEPGTKIFYDRTFSVSSIYVILED